MLRNKKRLVSCALSDKLATFAVSYSPQILTDMKRFVLFTMLAGILASCNSTLSVDNTPVAHLDLNRYLGEWYEIARFDHRFERGMEHTKASYALNEDGTVRVINSGIKNGKLKEAEGKAKLTDTPALLRVSFSDRSMVTIVLCCSTKTIVMPLLAVVPMTICGFFPVRLNSQKTTLLRYLRKPVAADMTSADCFG